MTTDRLALLVRFDIADSLTRLGLPVGAEHVAAATTPREWRAAYDYIAAAPRNDVTREEHTAVCRAVESMRFCCVNAAVSIMSHLRSDECDLDAYVEEVSAMALAAGVSL